MKRCISCHWFQALHRSLSELKNHREDQVSVLSICFESCTFLAIIPLAMHRYDRSHP